MSFRKRCWFVLLDHWLQKFVSDHWLQKFVSIRLQLWVETSTLLTNQIWCTILEPVQISIDLITLSHWWIVCKHIFASKQALIYLLNCIKSRKNDLRQTNCLVSIPFSITFMLIKSSQLMMMKHNYVVQKICTAKPNHFKAIEVQCDCELSYTRCHSSSELFTTFVYT